MSLPGRSSKSLLELSSKIASFYRKCLIAVLSFSFLAMLVQSLTGSQTITAVSVILFALWLIAGLVVLLLCGALRLYASRVKKREAEQLSQRQRAEQIALFRAAEDAREAASSQEAQAHASSAPGADLPDVVPTVSDSWKDKALEGRRKADALEGAKPDVHPFLWQDRLIADAERLSRFAPGDIELMRRQVKDDTHIFRMRERIGYFYIDVCRPDQGGELRTAGWAPLSALNVLHAAYPDHPEVIARVLASAGQERRAVLNHALSDLMDEAPLVAGVARTWSDMLYLSRESAIVCKQEDGIEVRLHTEHNPTPRNHDPRKIHEQHWLSVGWKELPSFSEAACLKLFKERNPLNSAWWIGKLAANPDFSALFSQKE